MKRPEGLTVRVGQANGRPMLSRVGERPLREVTIVCADSCASVTIDDVISPSILERLAGVHRYVGGPRGRSAFLARAARIESKREQLRMPPEAARRAMVGTPGWRSEDRDPWGSA